ncbi:tumor protein D52 isoform X2 [Culicoides brevitarsis]|uniref:tumor protein D52 isoform X2 n=1 Tax=Culicoides brevitarsis TaxID=469753 RepID=UPI00307B12D3
MSQEIDYGKNEESTGTVAPASEEIDELAGLSIEEQEQQRAEWRNELVRVEEEITTLRTVLQSKIRHASELKRKLGVTVWKEMSDDVSQSLKTVKESNVFQKTESVVKTAAEKTSSLFSGITGGFTSKISQMKNSESFKSFEERVGNAYENVKTKVSTSRSGSITSFNEVQDGSLATTPTISEKDERFNEKS